MNVFGLEVHGRFLPDGGHLALAPAAGNLNVTKLFFELEKRNTSSFEASRTLNPFIFHVSHFASTFENQVTRRRRAGRQLLNSYYHIYNYF